MIQKKRVNTRHVDVNRLSDKRESQLFQDAVARRYVGKRGGFVMCHIYHTLTRVQVRHIMPQLLVVPCIRFCTHARACIRTQSHARTIASGVITWTNLIERHPSDSSLATVIPAIKQQFKYHISSTCLPACLSPLLCQGYYFQPFFSKNILAESQQICICTWCVVRGLVMYSTIGVWLTDYLSFSGRAINS